MDDNNNNNEVVDMINKLVDSGIINNPESVKILTDYHIKMTEALTEKEKVEVEKKKIFRDELESMFNFGVNLIDHGITIIERHNEIEQSQQ